MVCGWLTVQGLLAPQGEFTFGVPQFNLLFSPILICLAAGLGLVAFRLVHGPWWTLGLVVVNFGIQVTGFLDFGSEDGGPVDTRFAATFLLSAVVVEVVARVCGTQDKGRFALLSGLGIGTLGLAGEYAWNSDAWQPWTSALLPEAIALGVVAAVGAAVLGVAFARAITRDPADRPLPGRVVALAALACLAVVLVPMRRPTGDVEVAMELEHTGEGTAFVEATLSPPGAADDAYWFQVSAWQGGGLELAEMEATGTPGQLPVRPGRTDRRPLEDAPAPAPRHGDDGRAGVPARSTRRSARRRSLPSTAPWPSAASGSSCCARPPTAAAGCPR